MFRILKLMCFSTQQNWGQVVFNHRKKWRSTGAPELISTAKPVTFGNEGAVPAEGGVLAGGGVAAKQRLRFVGEETFGAVHRRLLHACAAGPAHAAAAPAAAVVAAAADAAGRVQRLVDGAEALAYIH